MGQDPWQTQGSLVSQILIGKYYQHEHQSGQILAFIFLPMRLTRSRLHFCSASHFSTNVVDICLLTDICQGRTLFFSFFIRLEGTYITTQEGEGVNKSQAYWERLDRTRDSENFYNIPALAVSLRLFYGHLCYKANLDKSIQKICLVYPSGQNHEIFGFRHFFIKSIYPSKIPSLIYPEKSWKRITYYRFSSNLNSPDRVEIIKWSLWNF